MSTPPSSRALRARWINSQTIVLPAADVHPAWTYFLNQSTLGEPLALTPAEVGGVFRLPGEATPEWIRSALKGKLAVTAFEGQSEKYSTGVQTAGVIDELFYFDGRLGTAFIAGQIQVSLWAPTARSVQILLFRAAADRDPAERLAMRETNGVWSIDLPDYWRNRYYLFRLNVFVPALGDFVDNEVTDPYSKDLALNGIKSRLTSLDDSDTKPDGWDAHNSPPLDSLNDLTIYELHVRDFSAHDESVPEAQRGGYLAFTHADSNGMRHLRRLKEAGICAVHLLPTFHFASVDEDKAKWQAPPDLSHFPPDSGEQQAAIAKVADSDAYNWGYDPVHYLAREGSYCSQIDKRIFEYRTMVQALHALGLQVIEDQVFNHTSESGQTANSILDKIVPGYYYRLDENGHVLSNTCCHDTASERRMMEKLMLDSIHWSVEQYKINGFRFDLMGYHYVANMRRIKESLPSEVYLYGEGWAAGETAGDPDMPNATQLNLYGLGIGTFNDRMRDGIRGGSPFSDPRQQGFATGAAVNVELVRAGLAGNLRDFRFAGNEPSTYNGQPIAYAAGPLETINYCSAHDNQTLFDAVQMKSPSGESTAQRARRQVVALSLIVLAQGIPFFQAGDELLRSKSLDNDSFNSGDWFNKLDYASQTNNWGVGLPPASRNQSQWPIMRPLLADKSLRPAPADIAYTLNAFEALLRVRSSSRLFRLRSLAEIQAKLTFIDVPAGVIAMRLDAHGQDYGPYSYLLVIFNAGLNVVTIPDPRVSTLHSALSVTAHYDRDARAAQVAPLTTAVFV